MSSESHDLAQTVRRMLASRFADTIVLNRLGEDSLREEVDHALHVELGLAGLLVSEDDGGLGGTLADAAAVAFELGASCAPSNFLTSTVLAEPMVVSGGGDRLGAVGCLAISWDLPPGGDVPRGEYADGQVSGTWQSVAGAIGADYFVVPASSAGQSVLVLVEAGQDAAVCHEVTSLDQTRPVADLSFDHAPATVLVEGAQADESLALALLRSRAVLASEQAGIASWCLDTTVEYVLQRRQFGRQVGSFQALKHRLAYAWIDVQSACTAAEEAAESSADDQEVLVCVAQSACSEIAFRVAEECIQMHGGIGMTWEHPAHLRLKRALVGVAALGSPEHHRQRLASLVDLPG